MFTIYLIASFLIFISKSQTVKTTAGLSCQHGLRPLVDCMPGLTTQQSCEARGCCYRNYGEGSIEPWCSYPACSYVDKNNYAANPTNCQACFSNYHLTVDTKICYQGQIDNYFLDNDNIYKRCHQNCLRCNNALNQNCISCKTNYHLTEDTKICYTGQIDNYFLDNNNIYKKCHQNCIRCNSGLNQNCISCKANYHLTEDTKACYQGEINNYYLDNNIYRKCHQNCLKCNNGLNKNCIACQVNYHFTVDTKACYQGQIDNYYLDNDNIYKNVIRIA